MMEFLLKYISRKPGIADIIDQDNERQITEDPLSLLRREFPNLSILVKGKRVVDFGCGCGQQAISLFQEEDCYVCGIETNINMLIKAKKLARENKINNRNICFIERPTNQMYGTFDVVISQNAMEHYPDPVAILNEMKKLVHRDGKIIISFGPPWYAPYGSHMRFFCKFPWLNILFSERTVMNVRAIYRQDGATRYEEVESGLNKMSIKKFESIVVRSGLRIQYKKYQCVKGMNWLGNIPILRELFVNHISCILITN